MRTSAGLGLVVLVDGTVIVRESEGLDGVFPGQPIRDPVEGAGRWVPLERESYLEDLLRPKYMPDTGIGGQ